MQSTLTSFLRSRSWPAALLGGTLASVVYTAVIAGYTAHPASNVSVGGSIWGAAVIWTLLNVGSIGLPVALWLRYRLYSPLVLMALVLLFWHVLVEFPPIGSGQGDSPGFTFVFAFAPFYAIAYGMLGGGEYWLRRRVVPGRVGF